MTDMSKLIFPIANIIATNIEKNDFINKRILWTKKLNKDFAFYITLLLKSVDWEIKSYFIVITLTCIVVTCAVKY